MIGVQCIITGCDLVGPDEAVLHGDLFECGETYIFNGSVKDGKAAWMRDIWEIQVNNKGKFIRFVGLNMFEKRGVIVMHKSEGRLSEGALHYLDTGRRL